MAGVTLALIGFFVFLWTKLSTGDMVVLYTDLDSRDSNQIVAQLQSTGVAHKVSKDGAQISVPSDQVNQLRLSLAQQGIPASGNVVGYEILDRDQALGTSLLIQNVNRVRALEGELARTIAGFQSVRAARVHLVLPQRELFSREQVEPSASVILRMRGAGRLDRGQVLAVQHLVANAVPALKTSRISIVDDRGSLLARGSEDGAGAAAETANERQIAFEARLASKLVSLLEPSVGIGNVRAEVRAEMDFDRVQTTKEIYDPEGQVVRSTQSISDSSTSSEAGDEPVSVGQNLPDAPNAQSAQSKSQSGSQRTEESTNFEISKTITNEIKESGEVRRISVAVLVNGSVTPGANGQETYRPRENAELQNIEKLVKSAIGFDATRNDTVQIVNMRFAPLPQTVEEDRPTILGYTFDDVRSLVKILVSGILFVLVMLLVVRPILTRLLESAPRRATAGAGADEQQLLASGGGPSMAQLEAPLDEDGMPIEGSGGGAMTRPRASAPESTISLENIEGRVKESSLKKIGEIIDKHPEEAVAIIRNWMYQDQSKWTLGKASFKCAYAKISEVCPARKRLRC
jgi:flagellar M-ring protein FliF